MADVGQVEATQADRDLAKRLFGLHYENRENRKNGRPIVTGLGLIARHRIEAEQAQSTALAEVQAKLDAANGRVEALEAVVSTCAIHSNPDWPEPMRDPAKHFGIINAATYTVIDDILRKQVARASDGETGA